MVCKENMIFTQSKSGVCKCWGQRCVPTWANCYVKLLRWSIQVCMWCLWRVTAMGVEGVVVVVEDVVDKDQYQGSGFELANLSSSVWSCCAQLFFGRIKF